MWFGLLGPLRVRMQGMDVPVPAPKQRVLLAALLLSAGQPVSCDRLAELVWDGTPPDGAAVTLRSYVKRLRQLLGPDGGSRIITRWGGYLIECAKDEFDIAQYEALCGLAEAAVRAGAWQRAERLLSRARVLWRGAPLTDVPSQALQAAEVPRLEQLWIQATQWRIDADLRLGRCAKVVPELSALTAEHPLREPFHYQLMTALYQCGRTADALAAFRRARDALINEIGLEPGPDLQQLHQRMLAGDPELIITPARLQPGRHARDASRGHQQGL
jgi:DNA-binding SARP family transcriptional activator